MKEDYKGEKEEMAEGLAPIFRSQREKQEFTKKTTKCFVLQLVRQLWLMDFGARMG